MYTHTKRMKQWPNVLCVQYGTTIMRTISALMLKKEEAFCMSGINNHSFPMADILIKLLKENML